MVEFILYHRDEGEFKSLSEILIDEGMAAPVEILQPQDEAGSVFTRTHIFTKAKDSFQKQKHN